MLLPRGATIDGKFDEIHDVDLRDPEQVQEFVDHSWYKYADGKKGLHPWDGVTDHAFELPPGSRTVPRRSLRGWAKRASTPGSRARAGRAT